MIRTWCAAILLMVIGSTSLQAAEPVADGHPTRLIFDTDLGNDIDDALALALIHALQSRGECQLLAVTINKDNQYAAPFCDIVNTFYGRGDIPIGMVRNGKTPKDSPYLSGTVLARDNGQPRYPHTLTDGRTAPDAVALLRQTLSQQPDQSVTIVAVGFCTNLARLLDSPADNYSSLTGSELVARKCRLLSMMSGMFSAEKRVKEYNVYIDVESARKVYADWPAPIVASGYEVGQAIKYPAVSIERDFRYVEHHPVSEAYKLYQKMPYDRQTWDLTSVLYAVRPDRGYFGLSQPGTVTVDDQQVTQFAPSDKGRQRYLTVTPEQIATVREAFVELVSQPPCAAATSR